MEDFLSLWEFEPWNRFTAGLVAAMAVARALDFLSTWIVTPRLELEANPLMGWMRRGRAALTIVTKSFRELGVTGQEAVPLMGSAGGAKMAEPIFGGICQEGAGQPGKMWIPLPKMWYRGFKEPSGP